ncbi:MAG: hypothetical protein ACJ782_05660 [Actinomycetota bacterium]
MPPQDRGLLARLDALVELAADRHGLALAAGGRLAAAEARAAGLTCTTRGPTPRGPTARGSALALRDAVELLRAVGEGVGLLRVRGDRLEATSLRHAWAQIDPGPAGRPGLRRLVPPGAVAGVPARRPRGRGPGRRAAVGPAPPARPARRVDVGLQGLVETVANGLELDLDDWLPRALAAAFLDPLVALGVADIHPPPPHPGASLRLGPRASTVIGSALVAAGEEVSLTSTPAN